MAVNPIVLRIAFMLTLAGWRLVQGPAVARLPGVRDAIWDRLRDPSESDEDLSAALSARTGYAMTVATYEGAFELRKIQLMWSALDLATGQDDARVCTFHLIAPPGVEWTQADFDEVINPMDTWWNAIKGNWPAGVVYDRIKVYKDGPEITPPQVPVYDVEKNLPGTSPSDMMPPQVAISVTEKAGSKRHWGRFYLPAPALPVGTTYGRLEGALQTAIADATDTLYQAWMTAGRDAVVYRRALPERQQKNGVTLPARPATAWTVEQLQVDDVFDVIRSRRWKYPALRVQRDVA